MSEQFTLRAEHRKILAAFHWEEGGEGPAPMVDSKRPFGGSGRSAVCEGLYEALHGQRPDRELTEAEEDALYALHAETLTALMVILQTGSAQPGVYVHDGRSWGPRDMCESDADRAHRYALDLRDLNEENRRLLGQVEQLNAALDRATADLTRVRGGAAQ